MDFRQHNPPHQQPLLPPRDSDPRNPYGYGQHLIINQPNPNPNINFSGRPSALQSDHHRHYSQPNYEQEMHPIRENRRSSSMKALHPSHAANYHEGSDTRYQSYSQAPYLVQPNAHDNGHAYYYQPGVVPWESESDRKFKIGLIDQRLDSGWFWVYKYWMVILYCISVLRVVGDVFHLFTSDSTFYYLTYIVLNVWEAQQYKYEYSAIADKKVKLAKEAVEMFNRYLIGGPVLYAIAEISFNPSNRDSNSAVIMGSIIYAGLFYLFIMRKAVEVVDLLKDRANLKQDALLRV